MVQFCHAKTDVSWCSSTDWWRVQAGRIASGGIAVVYCFPACMRAFLVSLFGEAVVVEVFPKALRVSPPHACSTRALHVFFMVPSLRPCTLLSQDPAFPQALRRPGFSKRRIFLVCPYFTPRQAPRTIGSQKSTSTHATNNVKNAALRAFSVEVS